jgi:hypothetical protein
MSTGGDRSGASRTVPLPQDIEAISTSQPDGGGGGASSPSDLNRLGASLTVFDKQLEQMHAQLNARLGKDFNGDRIGASLSVPRSEVIIGEDRSGANLTALEDGELSQLDLKAKLTLDEPANNGQTDEDRIGASLSDPRESGTLSPGPPIRYCPWCYPGEYFEACGTSTPPQSAAGSLPTSSALLSMAESSAEGASPASPPPRRNESSSYLLDKN